MADSMSAAKHTAALSASTRIDALMPNCLGRSDVEMANRAGFREAREAAAAIASEHDVIAADLLEALRRTEDNLSRLIAAKHHDEVLMTPWRDEVRAAIAKATGSAS